MIRSRRRRELALTACTLAFSACGLAQSDPVLAVGNACDGAARAGECTAISRDQFDSLVSVLFPSGLASKAQFAKAYAEILALASEAKRLGIDQSPEYREATRWLQSKTLADLLRKRLGKDSAAATDAEIAAYYGEQLARFEEVRLKRLVVPKSNFAAADQQAFEQRALGAAMDLRRRAVQGEDMDQLQKEAFERLGLTGLPPATDAGDRRRSGVPTEVSDEILSLPPGHVSKVEQEAYSFVIYKVEAKRKLPLAQVRDEIAREISREKLRQALEAITSRMQMHLSESYFGPNGQ